MKRYIILLLLTFTLSSFAINNTVQLISPYKETNYDEQFAKLYSYLASLKSQDIASRIIAASNYFMNKPYLLDALGEGPTGKFDQGPLYRDDAFDCQTYVETVLAVAFGKNVKSFKQHLLNIRYVAGKAEFSQRNHFTSDDWNKNNAAKGYLQDITYKFTNQLGEPIAAIAETIIDKPNWYKHLDNTRIKQLSVTDKNLLAELHQLANNMQQEKSVILYLPLTQLFDTQKKPRLGIFKQIPSPSIIEIVRPNWQVKNLIGTNLNVSHLGFAIRTQQGLMYREASSIEKKVIDISLIKYLSQFLDSKSVKGINVQIIRDDNL